MEAAPNLACYFLMVAVGRIFHKRAQAGLQGINFLPT